MKFRNFAMLYYSVGATDSEGTTLKIMNFFSVDPNCHPIAIGNMY